MLSSVADAQQSEDFGSDDPPALRGDDDGNRTALLSDSREDVIAHATRCVQNNGR
jgi:hypothetical protein